MNSNIIERLDWKTAATFKGYKLLTSFKNWSKKSGVALLRDKGSKQLYVIKTEFENAINKVSIQHIQLKYSCSPEEFQARMNFESEAQSTITEKNIRDVEKSNYQPKHEHELKFLSTLTANISEL